MVLAGVPNGNLFPRSPKFSQNYFARRRIAGLQLSSLTINIEISVGVHLAESQMVDLSSPKSQPLHPRFWLRTTRHYHLQTRWAVTGRIEDVSQVLLDTERLPIWWPQFLESETIELGGTMAQDRLVRVVTKGWLPYKLRFRFRMTDIRFPTFFRLHAEGDFEGVGCGRLRQQSEIAVVDFDWNIHVNKRLLYHWSILFKPLFIHNHRWLMARGQAQLCELLQNRSGLKQY